MHEVLLTGFPSVLAHRVLVELLASTTGANKVTSVFVLVRPKARDAARTMLETLSPSARARVTMLEGVVAAIDMGLSGAEYNDLCQRITLIHHTAHVAYAGVDRETAEHANVTGTREVLEIAKRTANRARLVHQSTCFVSGDRHGTVREGELDAGQGFRDVIEETRARAEKLIQRWADRVPAVVVRPSTIVGDVDTGVYDRLEGPYALATMLLSHRADRGVALPGDRDSAVHVAPVDYVARASVALGFTAAAVGRAFHLTDPEPCSVPEVFDAVAQLVGRPQLRGVLAPGVARAVMRSAFMQKLAPKPAVLAATLSRRVTYSTEGARDLLGPHGITCPGLLTYLPKLVDFARTRRDHQAATGICDVDPHSERMTDAPVVEQAESAKKRHARSADE